MRKRPEKKLILIGAPKCGTSTLATLLGSHPSIVRGERKEPRFFTDFAPRSRLVKGLMETDGAFKKAARALIPDPVRAWARDMNRTRLKITAAEKTAAFEVLKDDLTLARSLVPFETAHWTDG